MESFATAAAADLLIAASFTTGVLRAMIFFMRVPLCSGKLFPTIAASAASAQIRFGISLPTELTRASHLCKKDSRMTSYFGICCQIDWRSGGSRVFGKPRFKHGFAESCEWEKRAPTIL